MHAKFQKQDRMTYANITLKVNAKLSGTNHHVRNSELGFLGKDTMIVGIDVTHPSPTSVKGMPSVVGVVANVDENYSVWPASIRLQAQYQPNPDKHTTKPQEMVSELEAMMMERLDLYKKTNHKLPQKILVYRDGVSESQYDTVLAKELPGIERACIQSYYELNLPQISILIVSKRTHTRFYPTDEKQADPKGNPKPGTVVDRAITMEQGFDFYLQAHAPLTGTVSTLFNVHFIF